MTEKEIIPHVHQIEDLKQLEDKAVKLWRSYKQTSKSLLNDAIVLGGVLLKIKKSSTRKGSWRKWCKDHNVTESRANECIRLYKCRDVLEKHKILTIQSAIKLLRESTEDSSQKPPEPGGLTGVKSKADNDKQTGGEPKSTTGHEHPAEKPTVAKIRHQFVSMGTDIEEYVRTGRKYGAPASEEDWETWLNGVQAIYDKYKKPICDFD